MIADVPENPGKGHLFSYHRRCRSIILFTNEADISGNINLSRAHKPARNKCRFTALSLGELLFVHDGASGTNFCAGPAKPAPGFGEGKIFSSPDICFLALLLVKEHTDSAQLMASSDAAAAEDALVGIVEEERVRRRHRKEFRPSLHAQLIAHEVLFNRLEFTVEVLDAGAAIRRVTGEHEFHRETTHMVDLVTLGPDHHTLGNRGRTRRLKAFHTVYLDNTESARTNW